MIMDSPHNLHFSTYPLIIPLCQIVSRPYLIIGGSPFSPQTLTKSWKGVPTVSEGSEMYYRIM